MTAQDHPIRKLIDAFALALTAEDWDEIDALDKQVESYVVQALNTPSISQLELLSLLEQLKAEHGRVLAALEAYKDKLGVELRQLYSSHKAANKYLSNMGRK